MHLAQVKYIVSIYRITSLLLLYYFYIYYILVLVSRET